MSRNRTDGLDLANEFRIPLGHDFHSLTGDIIAAISAAANKWNYRAPASANGSRCRYFYAYLNRLSNRASA